MAAQGFIELLRLADRGKRRKENPFDSTLRWSGVAFSMMGHDFVAPFGDVAEVIYPPSWTAIPHTADWALGITNLRGRLLSLVDLAGFIAEQSGLDYRSGATGSHHKVMCLSHPEHFIGVWVDQVFGIEHFDIRSYFGQSHQQVDTLPAALKTYCQGYFVNQNKPWSVFMLRDLFNDTRFMNPSRLS